ncbi:hypothetical protein RN001_004311 [Aquatica leii]|uniref:Ionotropic glutamate receptor C-terminal domain-containing protein n=1 Tax=Aquatica leii TaxID=1421715 RepID=A0AAN7PAI1_9COLE|nr:hypothetical protein RN001_004311 [Aquatica leii]
MHLFKVLVLFLATLCKSWCKLDAIPQNIFTTRVSLAKCIGEVSESFFENGDLTLVALSTMESISVTNSSVATDSLLLLELFNRSTMSIVIKKSKHTISDESYIKKIDNYIIQIRLIAELTDVLQLLRNYPTWNALARFLIISSNTFSTPKNVASILIEQLWSNHIMNGIVLLVDSENKTLFTAYSWFPYSNSLCSNNDNEILEIDQCSYGKFKFGKNWYPNKIPSNLNGCSLRVMPVVWPPYVLPTDTDVFTDGVEIKLINTMSKVANFSVVYMASNKSQNWGFISENGTALGSLFHLKNEECDVVVGSFAATLERHRYFDYVVYNYPESLTWCVPHARDAYQWIKLFMVLPTNVTIFSYSLCIIMSILLWRICRVNPKEASSYKFFTGSIQNVFSVYFNVSVPVQPRFLRARFLFMLWVLFILHITALYQSSLISVLTKPNYRQQIKTLSDILEHNLDIWILGNMRRYFTENNDVNSKVKTVWKVCENIENCLYDTSVSKNSATSTPRLYLKYAVNHYVTKKGEPLLHCFKESIVTYPLEMLFYKGFPLRKYFEILIGRITSAGLIAHWEKVILEDQLKHKSYNIQHPGDYQIAMSHLILLFIVLFFGHLCGFIIFLFELYIYKKKNMQKQKK